MLPLFRLILTIIGLILFLYCLVLMSVGSINFGTIVPFLLGLVFIIHGFWWPKVHQIRLKRGWLNKLWIGLCWGFILWLISFIIFAFSLQRLINQTFHKIPDVEAIVVLGAGTKDNRPSPLLAKRLDAAANVLKEYPETLVITSGGKGIHDKSSSGQVMADYMHRVHSVPISNIIVEGRSTSTEENFLFSKPILNSYGIDVAEPIAIVTSDFHIIRAKAIAIHYGFKEPIMVPSTTPLYIRYNAWFREYFAFISGWLLNEY